VKEVCNEFGSDWYTGLVLTILPGIAKVGDYRCDPVGAGSASCIDHDEQLHQILVCGRAGRLNDKNVSSPDVFVNFDPGFAVGERTDNRLTQGHANGLADLLGQRWMR
jgi:hypothetical protein